uniref:Uncharacterized protein n=1 Tax=Pseudenhygromyxa salsuginis TaxID=442868 RepID=A0A3S7UWN3_9BACT|nr:hypothetical protein [Pseudenhygromyxa salsuginis]
MCEFDGHCATCEFWEDCEPFWGCADVECVAGTCVSEPWDCTRQDTVCHEPVCIGSLESSCGVDFCKVEDGVVDARINILAADFTVPKALDVGGKIDIYGYENCNFMRLVRDRVADEPLLIRHDGSRPDLLTFWPDLFGKDWDQLTAPLVLDFVDGGQCPPVEGEDVRGSLDVTLDGQPMARVFDTHSGAAAGGYFVSNVWMHLSQLYGQNGGIRVFRDDCVDCPASTFHDSCLEEAEPAVDDFWIEFFFDGQFQDNPHNAWHFECTVVAADAIVDAEGQTVEQRDLDCAAIFQSFSLGWCS